MTTAPKASPVGFKDLLALLPFKRKPGRGRAHRAHRQSRHGAAFAIGRSAAK